MFNQKIILASKSPRRSQLLEEAGFEFEVRAREVDESFPDHLDAYQVAEFIAKKKANAFEDLLSENNIVLAADTTVIQNGIIYGKPRDRDHALEILRLLSGASHDVVTGVCLFSKNKNLSFSRTSTVYIDPLSDEELDYYIDTYEPYDKAGAYGIQEWLGHCKISRIEGTYTNIMGLPVEGIYKALQNWDS